MWMIPRGWNVSPRVKAEFAVVLASTVIGGCSGQATTESRFEEFVDSFGVRSVVTHEALWPGTIPLPLSEPTAVIRSEASGVVIGSVRRALRMTDGGVAVIDGQGSRVLMFGARGEFERVLGERGEGPGEFMSPKTLSAIHGDTLVVYDVSLRRLTYFSRDGQFRVVSLQDGGLFPRTPMHVWAFDGDRILVLEGGDMHEAAEHPPAGPIVFGPPARLRVVVMSQERSREVFSGGSASEAIQNGQTFWLPVFGRAVRVDVPDNRTVLLTTSERHAVLSIDPMTGDVVSRMAFPGADEPLTQEDVSRLHREVVAAEVESGARFRTPDLLFDESLQPAVRPAFAGLLGAPNGFILARAFAPMRRRSAEWWVLGPEGSFRGRVLAPGRGDILEIGDDYLIDVVYDDFDVPKIEVRRLDWSALEGQ